MKILYTVFSFEIGGIERLLIDVVNNIELKNDDKLYICIINDIYEEELIKLINSKVEIKFLKRKKSSRNFKDIINYTKFVMKNNIDIIHCQNIQCVKFSMLCKILKPNIKIIHTVHSTQLYTYYNKIDVLVDKIFTYKLTAISQAVKDEILSKKVNKEIVLLYNAVNMSKFKNVINKEDKNNIVIGNVARISPGQKGQDLLIKAIKIVKDKYPKVKCYFAGECAPEEAKALEDLKELVEQEEVKDNVEFLGNVIDIPEFFSKIDLFVLPSRFEGFGIALIEAMAAKIPVVASDVDGPREIIGNNEYGILFENGNYIELADKIRYAIENLDNIDTDKISEYINDKFDIKTMTNKLYELYES